MSWMAPFSALLLKLRNQSIRNVQASLCGSSCPVTRMSSRSPLFELDVFGPSSNFTAEYDAPLYCMPRELEENGHINVQDPVNCLMHWMWCRFLDIWQVWLFSKTSISVLTVVNKENTHVRSEGNNWNIEDKVERISARLAWQAATVTWNRKITKNWSLRSFKPPE